MKTVRLTRLATAVALALAMCAAGCGARNAAALPMAAPADQTLAVRSGVTQHLLYISTEADSTTHGHILVYPASTGDHNAKLIREFYTSRPQGMWVDRAGDLYVVNTFNDGPCSLQAFRPASSTPFFTIANGLSAARSVAVDANGFVYVDTRELSDGKVAVLVFAPGKMTPSKTIELPITGYDLGPGGMTFDAAQNLYVAMFLPQTSAEHVFKIAPGALHATDLNLSGFPGGGTAGADVAFDKTGDLYVAGLEGIGVFAPGATKPFRTQAGGPAFWIDRATGVLYTGNAEYQLGGVQPINTVQLPYATLPIADAASR